MSDSPTRKTDRAGTGLWVVSSTMAFFALLLGGFGAMGFFSSGDGETTVGSTETLKIEVSLTEFKVEPASIDVQPGQKVADYLPGAGFFTRVFSQAVGPAGHVYAEFPQFMADFEKDEVAAIKALAADPHYANVSFVVTPAGAFEAREPLDLIWTSQNYHDLQFGLSHEQILALDRSILAALKPGGVLLVIDHVAAPGAGWSVAPKLHRIEPREILADMQAAGFQFEAGSDVLRNAADDHSLSVFDPAIRGHTDQVVYRFRKPR